MTSDLIVKYLGKKVIENIRRVILIKENVDKYEFLLNKENYQ